LGCGKHCTLYKRCEAGSGSGIFILTWR
jgi:hypothetical protein